MENQNQKTAQTSKMQIDFTRALYFIGTIFFAYIFQQTANGNILNYIHFDDVLNEMVFAFTSLVLALICSIMVIIK